MKKQLLSILLALVMVIGIIPANTAWADSGSNNSETVNYGTFIDGEHVINDMIAKNGECAHPRIIMSDERFTKLKASIGADSVTGILLGKLRSEADSLLKKSVSVYDASGEDHLLETSKRIQRRVAALAMAYNIFGDVKYAQRAYDELAAACAFPDWSPSHFLDTAEMITAFAYGYDWLYHWMNEEQRAYLRSNMIEKGLKQVMEDYEDVKSRTRTYKWYQDPTAENWKFVCNGSMCMAALAIGDEADAKDIASQVITYAYENTYDSARQAYSASDGTYIEGLGYWDYATYYLGLQSSALTSATGSDYGLADFEGLRRSVDFIRYMSSNTPKSFSFGDDGDSRDTGWAVFLWLGDYLNSYDLSARRLKKIENDSLNYLDLLWIDEDKKTDSSGDDSTDWGAVGASNASFRNTWDESGIVAALHVGENNYKYHGHFDLGTFYLESNGARFFTDLGNESYTLENRKNAYRIRAEGHNTLVINPSQELDQPDGAECLIIEYSGGNEAFAVSDLTAAYSPSGAQSVVRGLKMIKDKECVIIQDEITLNQPGEIYWFAHTTGQIAISGDGRSAIVTVGSEKMWVQIISEEGTFTAMNAEPLTTTPSVQGQADNSQYRKLAIHLTNTKDATISVACIPLKNGESQPSWLPSVKAISEWTPTSYTVTYNANGGSGSMPAGTAMKGEAFTLPANGFTAPEGKRFKGWATSASGTAIIGTTITVSADTILYAIWEDVPATPTPGDSQDNQTPTPTPGNNEDVPTPAPEDNEDVPATPVPGDDQNNENNDSGKLPANQTGEWKQDSTGWWYQRTDGIYPKDAWEEIDGEWYLFDASGYMLTGWQQVGGKWYYLKSGGAMAYSTVIDGYTLDASGAWVDYGWKQEANGWWYKHADGSYPASAWELIDGEWYLFDASGYMLTGWQKVGGVWYYLYTSGAMAADTTIDGYVIGASGAMVENGWRQDSTGWWYLNSDGSFPAACWKLIDAVWYRFNASGYMQTGWIDDGGTWYYAETNGSLATGWKKIGGTWYYFFGGGEMAADTEVDGYKINSDGAWVE